MRQRLREKIKGKSVLILGFGREGRSTYRLLKQLGGYSELAAADMNEINDIEEKVYCGKNYQNACADYDIIFKSPGVVLSDLSYIDRVTSQTDEMLLSCRDKIIGITGTKGKSTTTSLIYHVLKKSGYDAVLMGNIGIPAFDEAERAEKADVIVYELSCHQLEFAKTSPHIGILLNIFPEHLDHYGSFEKYKKAKQNIYSHMLPCDALLCGADVCPENAEFETVTFSMADSGADYFVTDSTVRSPYGLLDFKSHSKSLFGVHNMYNISVAYEACRRKGVTDFMSALEDFKALPHRLELFLEYGGVRFFDDSISTIPETTIKALSSIENVGTLIVGGMDRGISLESLCEYLIQNPVPCILLLPDTGRRIYESLYGRVNSELVMCENMKQAACEAVKRTKDGFACVLSPAAASYGFFKNFEERGDAFQSCISFETKNRARR